MTKLLTKRFRQVSKERPELSSYSAFAEAVRGQFYKKWEIQKQFKYLVNNQDYEKDDIEDIFKNLENLTDTPIWVKTGEKNPQNKGDLKS